VNNTVGCRRICLNVLREKFKVPDNILYVIYQHKGAQVFHLCFLIEVNAHCSRIAVFCFLFLDAIFSGRCYRSSRSFRGHGGLRRSRISRITTRNLFKETVNFLFKAADICSKRLTVAYFFRFAFEKITGTEHQVNQVLNIFVWNSLFAYEGKKILHFMGNHRHAVKLHHGRRAFNGMHDSENFIDAVLIKIFVFLTGKQNIIQMLQKVIRFKQENIQHRFRTIVHHFHSHLFQSIIWST